MPENKWSDNSTFPPVTSFDYGDFLMMLRTSGGNALKKISRESFIAGCIAMSQYNFMQGATPTGIAASAAPTGGVSSFANAASLAIFGHRAYYADLGTTATGIAYCQGATAIEFQFGVKPLLFVCGIQIDDLATVAEDYVLDFGWHDVVAAGDAVDGIYFKYKRAISPNWITSTANNSSRTLTPSSTIVVEDSLTHLAALVNAAGTNVDYFVNGSLIGSNVANIPTGSSRLSGVLCKGEKTAGTTNRKFHVKYMGVAA